MKGLLKYLSPFAPDQSGAASVLFDLGGITVICDAGGCTGNICGFDEPRWFVKKSAIFSAGLRDMDAILGRDDRLIDKLKDTAVKVEAKFATIIGTPVPAVIGTDYRALERMAEKRCSLPVLTVECTGTRLYDEGEEAMYRKLFARFAEDGVERKERVLGVIGATPLDISRLTAEDMLQKSRYGADYDTFVCYGMGSGLEAMKAAGSVAKNLVVSPAGIRAAKELKERFGTPYEIAFPFLKEEFEAQLEAVDWNGKKVLIVHQQAAAHEIREKIKARAQDADVTAATWFLQNKELAKAQDFRLSEEAEYVEKVIEGGYEIVIGDRLLKRPLKNWKGRFIEIPHFAVSGDLDT